MSGATLLREIEVYLRHHPKTKVTKFGRVVRHDPRFVLDLRNGRAVRDSTADKVRAIMAQYPDGMHEVKLEKNLGKLK